MKDKQIHVLLYILAGLSALFPLRHLFLPLFGDEGTYLAIAQSTLENGFYSYQGNPSTITPTIPFLLLLVNAFTLPICSIGLVKLLSYAAGIIGVLFFYKYLKKKGIAYKERWVLVILTLANPVFIAWIGTLYPDSFLLLGFWVFMYYYNHYYSLKSWIVLLSAGVLMVLTRYVYAVLGVFVIVYLWQVFKESDKKFFSKRLVIYVSVALLVAVPLGLWALHISEVEKTNYEGITYFARFEEQTVGERILSGLGIIKNPEVNRINGIPAFATLFIPKTGFRSWTVSLILMAICLGGFFAKAGKKKFMELALAIVLILLGFIYAGTGFSRYWLVLLPAFLVGIYLLVDSKRRVKPLFVPAGVAVSVIYLINELRITLMVL